jgi:hypothetical protein
MMTVIELGDIYHRNAVRQNLENLRTLEADSYSTFKQLNSGCRKKYSIWLTERTALH